MTVCRARRLVLAAAAALLLTACGGGDDAPAADGQDAALVDEDAEEASNGQDVSGAATDDPDAAAAPDDAAADEPDDAAAEQTGDGGVAEHRPPAEAQAKLDCDAVSASPPGAVIVFPSGDGAGWLDAGPGPVTVEVVGCSDTFEANLQYEAFHGQNSTPTLSGFTQGGTLGTWGAFSFEETYWTPGDWTVVVFDDDAATGDRVEFDEVTFTVE
jgi:hypothetical protein